MFRICLSLFGTTIEICDLIKDSPEADLYEIRLDLSNADPAAIRNATQKPLIFTAHGRPDLLQNASPFADYLDVEQQKQDGSKYIVSIHAEDIDPQAYWDQLSGDHITKIVLRTEDYSRISQLLALNRQSNAICFAQGEAGAFSRILSVFRGAHWAYASLPGRATGEGQFTLRELLDLYRVGRFDSPPAVFGIVGNPVAHSRSPLFHNAKFAEENLPWIYLPFPCKNLEQLFRYAPGFGIHGFSITHPYKKEVLPFLANQLDSCNTVAYGNGKWYGTNTDVDGVREMLTREKLSIEKARVVILGAGGTARTIASVIRPFVRQLIFLNRTPAKAAALAAEFQGESGSLDQLKTYTYDVLFQATSVGLNEGECPVNPDHLTAGATVVDVIYNPPETVLLRKAKNLGCRIINGESMFLAQAEAQFRWWKNICYHEGQ